MKTHNLKVIYLNFILFTSLIAISLDLNGQPAGFSASITSVSTSPTSVVQNNKPSIVGSIKNTSTTNNGYNGEATFDIKATVTYPNSNAVEYIWDNQSFKYNQTRDFTFPSSSFSASSTGTYTVKYYVYTNDRVYLYQTKTTTFTVTAACTPPSKPTGLTATAVSTSRINLSWNSVSGAIGYDLSYCDGTYIGFVDGTSYSHTGRDANTTYSYKVQAQKSATCVSGFTSCFSATTQADCTPPSKPTGLTATAVSTSQINLSWNSVSGAIGYDLSYCDGTYIGFVSGTSYQHTGRVANTAYSYKVQAQKSATCVSGFTSCTSATTQADCTPPSKPTGLTATAVSSSQINLSWNSVSGAIGYDLSYCDGTYIGFVSGTSYQHTGRVANTTYSYKVQAQKSATCVSGFTSCTSATTVSDNITQIQWSELTWNVKNGDGMGPGPNNWAATSSNVWVDAQGNLHLKIKKVGDKWYCSEIYSQQSFGYGEYKFEVSTNVENFDKNIVLGLFTYENDSREIDLEFARWGNASNPAGWYVVQPSTESSKNSFSLNLTGSYSTHQFSWEASKIDFQSYHGHGTQNLIEEWSYSGSNIPPSSGKEKVHLNLWLFNGLAPSNNLEAEVVIKSFTFKNVVPEITITSPKTGDNWEIGSTQNVTWKANGFSGNVKVEINGNYPSENWETLFENIQNDGTEQWTVTGEVGNAKRIRITSVNNTNIRAISDTNFSFIPFGGQMMEVPFYTQDYSEWCWAASTSMMLKYYGFNRKIWEIAADFDKGITERLNPYLSKLDSYLETYYGDGSGECWKVDPFWSINNFTESLVSIIYGCMTKCTLSC
jgi:hypothetical protein